MNTRLKNKIRNSESKRNIAIQLLDKSGYMILAFITLGASAITTEWSMQFIVLALIFGLKWVFTGQKQIIQIFTQEGGY